MTVPSGANVLVPPGALPAGTMVRLADAGVDPPTKQAIEDWRYWRTQGYEF